MSNVTQLRVIESAPQPDPNVVGELERLLEMAKAGTLTGLAACYVRSDGCVSTVIETGDGNKFKVGHGIGALAYRFHQLCHEESFK